MADVEGGVGIVVAFMGGFVIGAVGVLAAKEVYDLATGSDDCQKP
jgi:predicted TIM-barrel enzyme